VKNHEVHIIKTSKIELHSKDVKVDANMVNVNTLKQVSLTNLHVSEVTPQVSRIINSVLEVQSLKLQLWKFKIWNLKF
jgi:hypothetical protein